MRTARDSVTPSAIPVAGIQLAFGYANGRFRWTAQETAAFHRAGIATALVDVNGSAPREASILDVERGDAGPAQAPAWIRERNAFRGDAVVYCDLATLPGLLAATSRLTEPWRLWVAHWDGSPARPAITLPAHVILWGKQYVSHEAYDESAVYDDAWHKAAA